MTTRAWNYGQDEVENNTMNDVFAVGVTVGGDRNESQRRRHAKRKTNQNTRVKSRENKKNDCVRKKGMTKKGLEEDEGKVKRRRRPKCCKAKKKTEESSQWKRIQTKRVAGKSSRIHWRNESSVSTKDRFAARKRCASTLEETGHGWCHCETYTLPRQEEQQNTSHGENDLCLSMNEGMQRKREVIDWLRFLRRRLLLARSFDSPSILHPLYVLCKCFELSSPLWSPFCTVSWFLDAWR